MRPLFSWRAVASFFGLRQRAGTGPHFNKAKKLPNTGSITKKLSQAEKSLVMRSAIKLNNQGNPHETVRDLPERENARRLFFSLRLHFDRLAPG